MKIAYQQTFSKKLKAEYELESSNKIKNSIRLNKILSKIEPSIAIWHLIGFDELQHDYKNPVDQCNNLNPLVLPEYAAHALILILMMSSGEATSAILNIPLLRDPHYRIKESLLVYLDLKTVRLIKKKLNFKGFFTVLG